jgi:hypothetical protein
MRGRKNNIDDDHVDGMRLRLWPAATNGPIVLLLEGIIWAWRTMVEWYRQRKTPDSSTRALWQSYHQRKRVTQEGLAKKIINFALRRISFILRRLLYHAIKSCDTAPTALIPHRRKSCYGYLSTLKFIVLGWVWTREPWVQWQAHNRLTTDNDDAPLCHNVRLYVSLFNGELTWNYV